MNAINLDTATKAEITAVAKKPSAARAKRQANGPVTTLVIEAATGAVKVKPATMTKEQRAAAKAARYPSAAKATTEAKPEATEQAGNGVFGAIAGSLSAKEAEAAEQAAIAAIRAAKKPAPKIAAARPALTQRYSVSTNYKGKAGAMFAFMGRCATLGATFSREDAVASMTAKPPHEALTTRAQVLDYFAWAARHVLVFVAADQSVPTAAPAKAAKKTGKGAKKA